MRLCMLRSVLVGVYENTICQGMPFLSEPLKETLWVFSEKISISMRL